ncbi:MAG: ABC transporter ATP-binding protein [Theionarchaea archaeon]|nr:ABC transporter ATP-binding protein [Theionarchaea archaeon]
MSGEVVRRHRVSTTTTGAEEKGESDRQATAERRARREAGRERRFKWVIEGYDLYKSFQIGKNTINACNGISIQVRRGEFVAIVGPSGSGKSTLLNMLGGLSRPTEGRIFIDGIDITRGFLGSEFSILPTVRRRKVGFVFQFFNLVPVLSALENVELPMMFETVEKMFEDERRAKAMELLENVGLAERMHHKPNQLSGGQQQRVAVARALANDPSIVLADEPTGNLDSATGRMIVQIMKRLNEERRVTFLITTHDMRIANWADRILYLSDGLISDQKISADEVVGKAGERDLQQ